MVSQLTDTHVWDFTKYVRRNHVNRGQDLRKHWDAIGWMHGLNYAQLVNKHGGYISVDTDDFTYLNNRVQKERYFDLDTFCAQEGTNKEAILSQGKDSWQLICNGIPKDACQAAYYSISDSWCQLRRIHYPDPLSGYSYAEPLNPKMTGMYPPVPPPFRFDKVYKCKYCGTVTDCTVDEDVLCKDCREVFGHTYYSEL